MLTLPEATLLLLYSRRRPAGNAPTQIGPDVPDVLGRASGELRLIAVAALMELALRDRVRVQPRSPAQRVFSVLLSVLLAVLVVAIFVGPPLLTHMPCPARRSSGC